MQSGNLESSSKLRLELNGTIDTEWLLGKVDFPENRCDDAHLHGVHQGNISGSVCCCILQARVISDV